MKVNFQKRAWSKNASSKNLRLLKDGRSPVQLRVECQVLLLPEIFPNCDREKDARAAGERANKRQKNKCLSTLICRFMSMCSNVEDVEPSLLPREILPSTATSVRPNQVLTFSLSYQLFSIFLFFISTISVRCCELRGSRDKPAKESKI